jgi:hypothetical protein
MPEGARRRADGGGDEDVDAIDLVEGEPVDRLLTCPRAEHRGRWQRGRGAAPFPCCGAGWPSWGFLSDPGGDFSTM